MHLQDKQSTYFPKKPRKPKSAHTDVVGWEHCFNDRCTLGNHHQEKILAGNYPRKDGDRGDLSVTDRRWRKRTLRARTTGEGSEKTPTEPDIEGLQQGITGLHEIVDRQQKVIDTKSETIQRLERLLEEQQRTIEVAAATMEETRRRYRQVETEGRLQRRRMGAIGRDLVRLGR